MKTLLTGDSNLTALFRGYQRLCESGEWPESSPIAFNPLGGGHLTATEFFVDRDDHVEMIEPTIRRGLERLPPAGGGDEIWAIGVCAPLHTLRVWRSPTWARYAPVNVATRETPLSTAVIRQAVLEDQKYMLAMIEVLLRNRHRVFVVEGPPPFPHHPAFGATRADVIACVDQIYRQTVRAELARREVPVVAIPALCFDRKGLGLLKYARENDTQHGNDEYGQLLMIETLRLLQQIWGQVDTTHAA